MSIARYDGAEAVTPSDTVAQPSGPFKGLYVGGAGDVTILATKAADAASAGSGAAAVTFKAVPVGTILPVAGVRVNATLTTATQLVALY